jgi:SAM-dependent methyltransferase
MPEYVVEFGKTGRPPEADGRLDAPAFHRNHAPIWSVLSRHLGALSGDVLEVGSGTGQHVVAFARDTPGIVWWPSDPNDAHLRSIAAWRAHAGLHNVRAPMRLDLLAPDWGIDRALGLPAELSAIVCLNVLHIAPWGVAEGLLRGAARLLRPDGRLFVYGPFMRDGRHTAPSNAAFDQSLRAGNPEWGVRDTRDLGALAERFGLRLAEIVEMPANNLVLVFDRQPPAG